jgi:hypothetical protein
LDLKFLVGGLADAFGPMKAVLAQALSKSPAIYSRVQQSCALALLPVAERRL